MMALHTDSIAKNCASGGVARRIHGQNGDCLGPLSQLVYQTINKRTLARPRWTRDTRDETLARRRHLKQSKGRWVPFFDSRKKTSDFPG